MAGRFKELKGELKGDERGRIGYLPVFMSKSGTVECRQLLERRKEVPGASVTVETV